MAQSFTPQFSKINRIAVYVKALCNSGGTLSDLYVESVSPWMVLTSLAAALLHRRWRWATFNEFQVPEITVTPWQTYYLIVDSPGTGTGVFA